MKHLFLDTNEYIVCALLTEPDHTPEILSNIEGLLNEGKATLLLPELVNIEFSRALADTLMSIERGVEDLKKKISESYPQTIKRDKDDFLKAADDLFKKRRTSSAIAKAKISKLFGHSNTIRIDLTSEIFLNAYKRAIGGRKPYNHRTCSDCCAATHVINSDCIIFESLITELTNLEIKQLIFCSANIKDFASYNKKADKHELHEDLASDIPKAIEVKYYRYIADAIKAEFRTAIPKREESNMADIYRYLDFNKQFSRLDSTAKALQEEFNRLDVLLKPSPEYEKLFNASKDILPQSKLSPILNLMNSVYLQKKYAEISGEDKDKDRDKDKNKDKS